jgi:hypothetical protein
MEPTPVILMGLPRLIAGLIQELLAADGRATVVADVSAEASLSAAVNASGARVVVLADGCAAPAELEELLVTRPATRLVRLAELADGSPETVVRTIAGEPCR